jgi:hypothetical protein
MVGERSRTINGWIYECLMVLDNAVGMTDIKNLELKNRDWLSNHVAMTKSSVIARGRFYW